MIKNKTLDVNSYNGLGTTGTGNLAARYMENSEDFSGNKIPASKKPSLVETQTDAAYKKIRAAAVNNDTTVEQVCLDFLLTKTDKLEQYIRSKGETPVNTNNGIVMQAIILRMNDINVVAAAGRLTEDEAFREIQEAESDAILNSTMDKDLVLAPDVQAALNCLINFFLTKFPTSSIKDALAMVKEVNVTPLNNAIGDGMTLPTDPMQLTFTPATAGTGGDSSDSFWDTLDKIAGTATTIAGAIKSTSGAVSSGILNVGNAIQTTGANTGASAISLYMQRNGLTILIIVLLAIVLIIILVRVSRN